MPETMVVKTKIKDISEPVRLAKAIYRADNSTLFAEGVLLYPHQLKWIRREKIKEIFIVVEKESEEQELADKVLDFIAEIASDEEFAELLKNSSFQYAGDLTIVPSLSGESKEIDELIPGMKIASMIVSGDNIVIEAGVSLLKHHIDYLKNSGVNRVEVVIPPPEPPPLPSEQEVKDKRISLITGYDGDPEKAVEVAEAMLFFENTKELRLVEPLGLIIVSLDSGLYEVALLVLFSMPLIEAQEKVLEIFVMSDSELREQIKDMWLGSRNSKGIISSILVNLPQYDKSDKAELIDLLTEFPATVVEKSALELVNMGSQEIQLYAYALLNRMKSMRVIKEKKGRDESAQEREKNLKKAVKNDNSAIGRITELMDTIVELSSRIFAYVPGQGDVEKVKEAIEILGKTKLPQALGPLSHAVEYFESEMRVQALKSISGIKSPAQFGVMFRALEQDDEMALEVACDYFNSKRDAYTVSVLLRRCNSIEKAVRHRVYAILIDFPENIVSGVLSVLNRGSSESFRKISAEAASFMEREKRRRRILKVEETDEQEMQG